MTKNERQEGPQTKCCIVLHSNPKAVRLLTLVEEWIFFDKCPHKLDISFSQTLSLQEIFPLAYSIGRTLHDAHLLLGKSMFPWWRQRIISVNKRNLDNRPWACAEISFCRMWVSLTFWCLSASLSTYLSVYHHCSGNIQYQLDFKRHRSFILAVLFYNTFYKFNQCILIYYIV